MSAHEVVELGLLGRRVRVEATDPAFLESLARCYVVGTNGAASHAGPDLVVRIDNAHGEGALVPIEHLQCEPPDELERRWPVSEWRLPDVCSALNQWAVEQDTPYYTFHAGAAARDGRAILLPGSSTAGKSTTTAGLLTRGFELLSDEVGAVSLETRCMTSYPRFLSLREDVLDLLGLDDSVGLSLGKDESRMVDPSALGAKRSAGGERLSMIVLPGYREGAATSLVRMKRGPALIALMRSSCSQPRLKVGGFDWVIGLLEDVPCYELVFSNLDEALDRIEQAFQEGAA